MEAFGKLTNGELVFMRRTGKNSYIYADKDGNKVDGRKVKKFNKNTTNRGNTSVEAEKMKKKAKMEKKATPKPTLTINPENTKYGLPAGQTKDGKKVYLKMTGKNSTQYVDIEGNKVDGRKVKKINKNITNKGATSVEAEKMKKKAKMEKKATPKPVIKKEKMKKKGEFYDPDYDDYFDMDEVDKKYWNNFYDEQKKEEERKQKLADEIDAQKRAKKKAKATPEPVIKNVIIEKKEEPKKTTAKQPKQTADQLEKRRAKYQENKAKELARKKAYREANKEKINEYQDQYRASAKGKAYQKAYREENKKIPEPKRTKAEVKAGVKAFGLGKDKERYAVDINKKLKENKPRKDRTDRGKKRGKYDIITKAEMLKKYPRPKRKSGESEEVYNTRWGLWEKVLNRRLPPSMLTMKNAVKITYGDGITIGGKDMTTSEWMRKIEKETGRDIERDGLGVGNLKKADIDPDAVY